MRNLNRKYSYGTGPKISRRTLYRRRMAESRRVERLNQMQWNNTLDKVLMAMPTHASINSTTQGSEGTVHQDSEQQWPTNMEGVKEIASSPGDNTCNTSQDADFGGLNMEDSCHGGDRTDAGSCSGGERTDDGNCSGGQRTDEDSNVASGSLADMEDEAVFSDGDPEEHHELPFEEDPNEPSFDADGASLLRRLCDCTATTAGEALAMVMSLGVRHNLTWTGMVDILRLINVLFSRKVVPDTKYMFLKHVDTTAKYKLERHVYCAHCHRYFGRQAEEGDEKFECPCKPDKKLSFFMTIGLKKQLEDLLKRKDIQEALEHGFHARDQEREEFTDVYDGKVYRFFCVPGGFLFKNRNLTISFNTDGFSMGKSTKRSAWPIYVSLNELPPKLRFKHMMLAGIWVGPKDPNMFVFLRPFVDEVNSLSDEGVQWTRDGTPSISKVIPTCVCVDSPARCKVLNMKQFHGTDSCGFCYHKGDRVQGVIGLRYSTAGDLPDLRTDHELRSDMDEALERIRAKVPLPRQVVRGVCGPSALKDLNQFNLATMIVPDIMHLYKLVETMLLTYQDSSIKNHLDNDQISRISLRLESFRPPSAISRTPRPLSQLKLKKCNELRNDLLLYGVIAMKGILCDKYVAHFSLLSSAVRLLTHKTVKHASVLKANAMLFQFVCLYEEYFGLKAMTINVHLLLHLCKAVLDHGPLWASNCFPYEGEHRNLLNSLHSPAAVAQQMTRKFICKTNSSILCDKYRVSEEVRTFCETLGVRRLKHFQRSEMCILPGYGMEVDLCQEEQNALRQLGYREIESVKCFEKVIHGGIRLTSCNYSHGLKTDDSVVLLCDSSKAQIMKICHMEAGTTILIVRTLVEDINPVHTFKDIKYTDVTKVVATGALKAINIKDIVGQCLLMEVDGLSYVTEIPFGCYGD